MDDAGLQHNIVHVSGDGCMCAEMQLVKRFPAPNAPVSDILLPLPIRTEISRIMAPFERTADKLLSFLVGAINRHGRTPWALVLFRSEYPISGTFAEVRVLKSRLPLVRYSLPDLSDGWRGPRTGGMAIPGPETIDSLGHELPGLNPVWDVLRSRDPATRWICIAPEPEAVWLEEATRNNAERYQRAQMLERKLISEAGYQPILTDARFLRAVSYEARDDPADSLRIASELVAAFPHHPLARVILGDAEAANANTNGAMACYRKAICLRRDHAVKTIEDIRRRLARIPASGRFRREVLQARINWITHETTLGAVRAWQQVIKCHKEHGDLDAALWACRNALDSFPAEGDLWQCMAELCECAGDAIGALKAWHAASFSFHIMQKYCFQGMARAHGRLGNHGQALLCWRRFIEFDSDNPYAWADLARTHMRRMEFDAAARCWDKAIELPEPSTPEDYRDAAETFLQIGRHSDAAIRAATALQLDPTPANRRLRARAALACGDYDNAIRQLTNLIGSNWHAAETWYYLGLADIRAGKPAQAHEVLRQLRTMDLAWSAQLQQAIISLPPHDLST